MGAPSKAERVLLTSPLPRLEFPAELARQDAVLRPLTGYGGMKSAIPPPAWMPPKASEVGPVMMRAMMARSRGTQNPEHR